MAEKIYKSMYEIDEAFFPNVRDSLTPVNMPRDLYELIKKRERAKVDENLRRHRLQ